MHFIFSFSFNVQYFQHFFFFNLNIHLKLYAFLFPWVQLLSGWGSKLLLIIALKLYPTTGWVTLSLSSLSNLMVCIHGLMGMISSHKMHMTKSSTCFTNALQHLYPVTWIQLKTWYTVEALLGMTVGFSRFLNGYLGSMHKEFTQNLSIR